jgi:hypothetical protein
MKDLLGCEILVLEKVGKTPALRQKRSEWGTRGRLTPRNDASGSLRRPTLRSGACSIQRRLPGIVESAGIVFAALFALLFCGVVGAATARGTVYNRTTGRPAAGVELALLDMMAGASQVAATKSDEQGQFTFDNDGIGRGPMLIRASFAGVTFNTALPPGRPSVDVDVFEVSKDPKMITVVSHIVVFQPRGDTLLVGEEYVVQNSSQPARAYFRGEGDFDFGIPENAKLQNVSTTSSTGMPVQQAAIDKAKGRNAIAYTFRPGETSIRLSYEVPYAGNAAALKLPSTYADMKMLVVAPPGVTIAGEGLSAAGQEQGMMVYTHAPLAAEGTLALNVSGVGAPGSPQDGQPAGDAGGAAEQSAPAGQGGMPQQGNSRLGGEEIQAVPGRLDVLKWPILVGFAALFALGAVVLTRKQVVVSVPVGAKRAEAHGGSVSVKSPVLSAAQADVQAQVNLSLDALKDALFRLELRRQAGTISEEEYAAEREGMEKRLRDLVRG